MTTAASVCPLSRRKGGPHHFRPADDRCAYCGVRRCAGKRANGVRCALAAEACPYHVVKRKRVTKP